MRALFVMGLLSAPLAPASAQPVSVPRVEAMAPLSPTYGLRNWKQVARAFDSLAFDPARQGPYLPLNWTYTPGVNYPEHAGFGLSTYVGSPGRNGEAIAALPALVGATLVGANKRTQFGQDWVRYAEDYFNRSNGEDVYLNNTQGRSGQDGWYDTMPNVFFLQLAEQYPGVGAFEAQRIRVAERWLAATQALGAGTTPYALPDYTIRAIALRTMTPLRSGVVEPEMAGAVGWILYNAYVKTGDERYRVGAEQALGYLDGLASNPSYELQLPYGALAAARMNAEVGTHFNVEKLVNWTFDRGSLRGWGIFVGQRGGVDLTGLIGEVDGDGYVFALNGFQMAAALVPLVRYDDRFARSIGRWMGHLASASRQFYSASVPVNRQDGYAWAGTYDPRGAIPYEAVRGAAGPGGTPFATGDAVRGGWAATNLSLYSGGSVGYLAALVDSTDVPGVLRLNLTATDFARRGGYASYLYYNPHATSKTVTLTLPFGTYDLYDAASDAFVARSARTTATVDIPADAARVIVLTPAGGTEVRSEGRMSIAGVVVDYRVATGNRTPRVRSLARDTTAGRTIGLGEATTLYCSGDDPDNEALSYAWTASGGTITPAGATATFRADAAGTYTVACAVRDAANAEGRAELAVEVVSNRAPAVTAVQAVPPIVDVGETSALSCAATDPDGGPAPTYAWEVSAGSVSGAGATVTFQAPDRVGVVTATCVATDAAGAEGRRSLDLVVGRLVLSMPLDGGQATDTSGFAQPSVLLGTPAATTGRLGAPASALRFDGVDDAVEIDAVGKPALNMPDALTVSVWVNADASAPARERYVVSHGSYEQRYKLSLLPQNPSPTFLPRWTVRTSAGIVDLDATRAINAGQYVHLAATFDGANVRIFVDGQPAGSRAHTGTLAPATVPLLLGQMLPSDAGYNFAGALDDVRLYNRALSSDEIQALYLGTATDDGDRPQGTLALGTPVPNPSSGRVALRVSAAAERVHARVFDVLGREVAVLFDGPLRGEATVHWDGRAADGSNVQPGLYLLRVSDGARTFTVPVVRF